MKIFFTKLLKGYDYNGFSDLLLSLAPSFKYGLTLLGAGLSAAMAGVETMLGFTWQAFLAFNAVMFWELISGIMASRKKQEGFSSMKLSRFGFKVAQYLILIGVPYLLSESFRAHGRDVAAELLDWLYVFLTLQIVVENIISILENDAVIRGKEKSHWIAKIQKKVDSIF